LPEFVEPVIHRDSPASPRQFPEAVLEVGEGGIRLAQLVLPEGEAQKDALCALFLRLADALQSTGQYRLPNEKSFLAFLIWSAILRLCCGLR